jgi:hypothetical protein
MGDRRKLHGKLFLLTSFSNSQLFLIGEIDRCLKKVAEGVETFEDIWQKVEIGIILLEFLKIIALNRFM